MPRQTQGNRQSFAVRRKNFRKDFRLRDNRGSPPAPVALGAIHIHRLESRSYFTSRRNKIAMRAAPAIELSDDDRVTLERWSRGRSTPARLVLRSKIVLLAAAGRLNKDIAVELQCGTKTVCLWRRRFAHRGIPGIEKDAPRGAKRSQESEALIQQLIHKTLYESPPHRARWSTRSLAAALGTSPATVQRVWKLHGVQAAVRYLKPVS